MDVHQDCTVFQSAYCLASITCASRAFAAVPSPMSRTAWLPSPALLAHFLLSLFPCRVLLGFRHLR
eukprot:1161284-Pelagomonas_calceolata.AAC.1